MEEIFDILNIYGNQVEEASRHVSWNYSSIWNLIYPLNATQAEYQIQKVTCLIAISVLGMEFVWLVKNKIEMTNQNMIWISFLTTYSCVLFLPSMHERYGYIYEILAIFVFLLDKRTLKYILPLYLVTLTNYSYYLFAKSYEPGYMSLLNLVVFLLYFRHYIKWNLSTRKCEGTNL